MSAAKRGHWPKGKRRHPGNPREVQLLLALLRDYLASNRQAGASGRRLAVYLGVSERTLRRWLAGEDWPPPDAVDLIRAIVEPAERRRVQQRHSRPGRETIPGYRQRREDIYEELADGLRAAISRHGATQTTILGATGLTYGILHAAVDGHGTEASYRAIVQALGETIEVVFRPQLLRELGWVE